MVNADINLTPTATLFEVDLGSSTSANGAKGSSGKITGRTWGSVSDCQAAVLLVHGLGAHSGWFEPLARRLKVRKLFVLSYDLVGFGKRIDQYYYSPDQWLADLIAIYSYLEKLAGDKPIYLVGNSMGSIIALQGCQLLRPAGLALLSPGFEGHPQTFPLSYRITAVLQALLKPKKDIQLPYDLELVTNVPSVREWLVNDPERRFTVPGRMLLDLLFITQKLRWKELAISCPAIMMTAGKDMVVDNRINQQVFDRLICPKKRSRRFETAFHDLPLDPALDEVANELTDWIMPTRSARPASADTTSSTVSGVAPYSNK
jgi:alpha-beta hydrolase superfamily lysophospholipase